MKRFALFSLGFMVMVAGLCASGRSATPGVDNSWNNVASKGKFVLGLDDSFPPMGYRNEANEIIGYDIDLAKEAAKRLGVQLILQPIDWNAKEQELNTGEIDCIWNGFTITEERKQALNITEPYLSDALVFAVRPDSPIKSRADLAGTIAGVQTGSSSASLIDDQPEFKAQFKEIIGYKDYLAALMDLEVGGVDVLIIDRIIVQDNMRRSGKTFRILDEVFFEKGFGIAFRKNDIALSNKIWETLEAMAADGTFARITTAWFGSDISTIKK
ncbi:MAG: amino acid ABC transporter substrate-binding protein [Treponema sp.]|jgi:polar amino acid transport system substrate-binding protein|nr:amino acid ABC transporter substrate-binding protein [Treponema sp.]